MDEPDFDDLIEDYMEDFDEPPPSNNMAAATSVQEYDEDFLEEMEATAGAPSAAANNNNNNTADNVEEQSPASPISTNLNGRLFAAESPPATATATAAQIRSQLASSRSRQGDAQPDIFSFERYVCGIFTGLNTVSKGLSILLCSLAFVSFQS